MHRVSNSGVAVRMVFVQAQRIMTNSTSPPTRTASSATAASLQIHFAYKLSFATKGPKAGFPPRRSFPIKCGRSIGARAAVPLPSPLHAREFHGCAQHGCASALPERPVFVGFQCFVVNLGRPLCECRHDRQASYPYCLYESVHVATAYTMSSGVRVVKFNLWSNGDLIRSGTNALGTAGK